MSETPIETVHFLQIEAGEGPPLKAKERILFSLVSRLYQAGRSVLVTASSDHIHGIDQMLWGYQPESFIPHGVLPCELDALSVLLTHRPCEIEGIDVLIVASPVGTLEWMARFPLVIDFVELDVPPLKEQSRQRFREWRERGIKPAFHKVQGDFDIHALIGG